MAKNLKRSEKYDFFKPKSPQNLKGSKRSKKEKIKLGFKWIKVTFFVFLAGLSLTGCVQSFVLKSSSTAGSGIEFYKGKDSISPFVSTYQVQNRSVKDENGNKIDNQELVFLPKDNYLLTNSENDISEIRKQWENKGLSEEYGKYDNYSSALRIVDKNGVSIFKDQNAELALGDNPKAKNDAERELMTINNFYINKLNKSPDQFYEYKNRIRTIPIFITKRPLKKPDKDKINAYSLPALASSSSFQPIQIYQKNGETIYQVVKKEDNKFINNINNKALDPTKKEDQEIINGFKYIFQYEMLNLDMKNSKELYVSQAYARDYLQSLANVVIGFNQFSLFSNPNLDYKEAAKSIEQNEEDKKNRLENIGQFFAKENQQNARFIETTDENKAPILTDAQVNKLKNSLINVQQKTAMEKYVTQITPLLAIARFNIKKMNFDGDNPNKWDDPYQIEFNNGVEQHTALVNGASIQQKPVLSWSQAWGLGPFYGFVVFPLAFIVNSLVLSIPSMAGWGSVLSIAIAVILSRLFTLLITYKSAFVQSKQQMLAPRKAKIDAKYAPYKGNKMMEQRKRTEISELYKKNNVNAMMPVFSLLISTPIFLAMWRVIQGNPTLKSTDWLGINFSSTSWQELFAGSWQYLPLMLIAVSIQGLSQFLPRILSKKRMRERSNIAEKEALRKANKTQNIVMIGFMIFTLIFEAGIQIYWIVASIWSIAQTLIIHKIQSTKVFKEKLIKYV